MRTSLAIDGASTRRFVEMATQADELGIDGLWVHGERDPAWCLTTLAAVAVATRHLRLGVVLAPGPDDDHLRLSEDLGVLDQLSEGRLEVLLAVPPGCVATDVADAWRRLFGAWLGWPLNDGAVVAVTPRPRQPWLPRLVLDDEWLAAQIGGGLAMRDTRPSLGVVLGRRVLLLAQEAWPNTSSTSIDELEAATLTIRGKVEAVEADEAVLCGDEGAFTRRRLHDLASTLVPLLRTTSLEQRELMECMWPLEPGR